MESLIYSSVLAPQPEQRIGASEALYRETFFRCLWIVILEADGAERHYNKNHYIFF